ncbi:helix-turn-helix domain-containing GNAT family N-acetyltransferase [Nisaea acidiphila]|uniref:Helix-turn-helix domain-containing GNAT family N-acetyltransferase n=1 Tax=Nisaea acidiphila TaxID=1862145 RepID=A0A9J7AW67_9PROT|nr:helix-turn-helix domain-containing GNAT family N-acetyltransferase [Nisaea acidiphila]UUX51042.1 helix-turn-helix domain-containing GNAT family N-acetyltransferase [Nisaea acidiphila]
MVDPEHDPVDAVRHFTRFFTGKVGVLKERLLDSAFTPPEARVIFELGHQDGLTARDLADMLALDPGYLSRLLGGLKRRGFVSQAVSERDRRRQILTLTGSGREAVETLIVRSRSEIGEVLAPLDAEKQRELVDNLKAAERLLACETASVVPVIRPHRAGDLSWILARQAALYEGEYGWDGEFERLLLKIGSDFVERYNPDDDCLWIAEHDGRIAGSAAVVRDGPETARLRIVYVEPAARGFGLGHKLVGASIDFARRQGYREMVLSTYSVLSTARRVYQAAGFELCREEPDEVFGQSLVEQHWRRDLA